MSDGGVHGHVVQGDIAGAVVGDQLVQRITLRRGNLRVRAHIQV